MRRQQNLTYAIKITLVALAVAIVCGGIAFLISIRKTDPFKALPEFPVSDYRQGEKIWGQSAYRLTGTLDNIILQSKDSSCCLIGLAVIDAASPAPIIIPVITPLKASKQSLQRKQLLTLKVAIDHSGRIIASDCSVK